tara:strand:+ start:244 stop:990 length:747 start_codon:yes stop_codon:yes gene_type:complete
MKVDTKIIFIIFILYFTYLLLKSYLKVKEIRKKFLDDYKNKPSWVPKKWESKIKSKFTKGDLKAFITLVIYYIHLPKFMKGPFNNIKFYHSWKEVELILAKTIPKKEFDCVVGITTGGAIISNYIAKLLNIPNYEIKVTTYSASKKQVHTHAISNYFECKKNKSFRNKCGNSKVLNIPKIKKKSRILLVDDSINSGATMSSAYNALHKNGSEDITVYSLVSVSNLNNQNIAFDNNEWIIALPWGGFDC